MVSQSATLAAVPADTRDRIFAAAATEFAARGFDGAKVHRIGARAGVNKAMLYYHFPGKLGLYRAILADMFGAVAAAVMSVRQQGGKPEVQLRGFIHAIADQGLARPHFPSMWLREIAEGGRHVDDAIVMQMRKVIETLAAILADGHRAGVFRVVNPFITQIGIVAPIMLQAASLPLRERFKHLKTPHIQDISRDEFLAHIEAATLAVVSAPRRSRSRS